MNLYLLGTKAKQMKGNIYCDKRQIFEYQNQLLQGKKGHAFYLLLILAHHNTGKRKPYEPKQSHRNTESGDTAYCVCN